MKKGGNAKQKGLAGKSGKLGRREGVSQSCMTGRRAGKSKSYLTKLKSFYRKNKRMPSYGEIATMLNFKSKFAALYQANKWIKAGIIQRDKAGKLIPGKQFQLLKVLGTIKAGWPSPAEEENADTISLDDWLIENKEGSYMLKVSGDSMIDAGIMPGDMVIIDRGRQAKNGDIVVAEVDGEWTVKYFVREGGAGGRAGVPGKGAKVSLRAANRNYGPIVAREELKVAGVVRAVVRKY